MILLSFKVDLHFHALYAITKMNRMRYAHVTTLMKSKNKNLGEPNEAAGCFKVVLRMLKRKMIWKNLCFRVEC